MPGFARPLGERDFRRTAGMVAATIAVAAATGGFPHLGELEAPPESSDTTLAKGATKGTDAHPGDGPLNVPVAEPPP